MDKVHKPITTQWYKRLSVLLEILPDDGPEGPKRVGENEHKIESVKT
jgi:hypothetical protein